MTVKDFMVSVQEYYGRYTSKTMIMEMSRWLSGCDIDLDELWKEVISEFSSQYGKVPDVSVLKSTVEKNEQLKKSRGMYRDEHDEVWSRGQFIGYYDGGRFFPYYGRGVPENVREMDHRSPAAFIEYLNQDEKGLTV